MLNCIEFHRSELAMHLLDDCDVRVRTAPKSLKQDEDSEVDYASNLVVDPILVCIGLSLNVSRDPMIPQYLLTWFVSNIHMDLLRA